MFLGATLESAAFLGVVVPGETLVVLGGALASAGVLDLRAVMVTASAGAVIGDSIGYQLGRYLGRPWLLRHAGRFGLRGLERVDEFFARHGGKAVFLGRFAAFLRATVPFVAGASRMRYREFLFYNVLGGVTWAVVFVLLGYLLGASWPVAERWIGRAGLVIALLAMLAGVLWLRRRARTREPLSQRGRDGSG